MKAKFPVIVLTSFIMGLLLTPLVYVAIGALGGFSMAFSILSLPLLLVSTLFLMRRFLLRISAPGKAGLGFMVVELVCWLLVGVFLFIVSGFTLLTAEERMGQFCVLLLIATVLATPLVLLRPSALARRVAQWPAQLVLACSLMAAVASIMFAVIHLSTPARFL
ncbi:MAG: hypothetical protein HEQ39_06585 [Rhizobacter sp.]